ncbi:TetR family transcriptional regulator, partial [Mycobacterium tuberculosis]|nr:TetR family transcriptional regulator [Mycobacterium tuberculosis]
DLEDLTAAAAASRRFAVLRQREARYLVECVRPAGRRPITAIVAGMRDSVLLGVPDLSALHPVFRPWPVFCTLASLGRHSLS